MSNISRRQFLKGAGVATLAVAAAGVLAGCSNVPDKPTPGVPDKTVHIYYMIGVQPVNGEPVEISVNGLATYVTYETIKANIPANVAADYDCAKKNYDIEKDGTVTVNLQKKAAAKPQKKVTIEYVYGGTGAPDDAKFTPTSLNVDVDAKYLTQDQLDSLVDKSGKYRVLNATELIDYGGMTQNGIIEGDKATVYIIKK